MKIESAVMCDKADSSDPDTYILTVLAPKYITCAYICGLGCTCTYMLNIQLLGLLVYDFTIVYIVA